MYPVVFFGQDTAVFLFDEFGDVYLGIVSCLLDDIDLVTPGEVLISFLRFRSAHTSARSTLITNFVAIVGSPHELVVK